MAVWKRRHLFGASFLLPVLHTVSGLGICTGDLGMLSNRSWWVGEWPQSGQEVISGRWVS